MVELTSTSVDAKFLKNDNKMFNFITHINWKGKHCKCSEKVKWSTTNDSVWTADKEMNMVAIFPVTNTSQAVVKNK